MKEFIAWALNVWPILAALGGVAILISGWSIKHDFGHHKTIGKREIHTEIQTLIKKGSDISERFRYGIARGTFGYEWPFLEFEEWREETATLLSKYGYNDEGVLWYRYVNSLDTEPPLPKPMAEACKKGLELLEKILQG